MADKRPAQPGEKNKPTVVGTGLIVLDVVVKPEPEQTPTLAAGGTCGNVLAILSYVGWKAYPVARLNGDVASREVEADLRRWAVDLKFATLQPVAETPMIVHRIRKDPTGIPFHTFSVSCPNCGVAWPRFKPVREASVRNLTFPPCDLFFMDRASPAALKIGSDIAQRGGIVFFEPSGAGDPATFRRALQLAHIVKYSHERAVHFDISASSGNRFLEIETLGVSGLRYRVRKSGRMTYWKQIDAFTVQNFRDAGGAGDWCTAGLIDSLGRGGRAHLTGASEPAIHKALIYAQALAAWSCRFEGARGGMYSADVNQMRKAVDQIIARAPLRFPYRDASTTATRILKNICPSCRRTNREALRVAVGR